MRLLLVWFCVAVIVTALGCGRVNAEAHKYPLKVLGLFPHPGISHFKFFHPIMRALAEAGNDVTVVSHFPDKSPPARYKDLSLANNMQLTNTVDLAMFEKRYFFNHFVEFFMLNRWGLEACNHTLRSPVLADILHKRAKWDVIIVEQFNSDCMMAVAHVLKAPVIALSSCALMPWHYDRFGVPIEPAYVPALFLGNSEEMNFFERFGNWFSFHALRLMYELITVPATDAMVQYKFGHQLPSVRDLAKETSLMFVNQHFSMAGAKPLPPSVVELGGVHIQKAKVLSVPLQRALDNAEHGVIFISWGSMIRADTLPAAKREGILKAVRRLKHTVIWKFENDTIDNMPDNMIIQKWLPQRDILCHPNVKLFMTHGGLMGSTEAAYCGVPVVATPMYGDQFLNSAAMVKRGMGTILHYEDISENTVIRAIKRTLEKKYMDNAKLVSHSFHHRPQTVLQTAMWWVEYIATTEGAPLLKSHVVHMPWYAQHLLDVWLVVLAFVGVTVLAWMWVIGKVCDKRSGGKVKTN